MKTQILATVFTAALWVLICMARIANLFRKP